ncbi:MAG: PHP domain-containing protein [Nitrospirae bacterium CG17_big_fil_post_rev_8_21_14_2_50_50_9]|nr:MAG: PHP domain-containing protein [Nitrospirae bacterium CG2_30_53_67]PIV84657.1 MAG: PHP domain-containing protein [Nitrospirae bacterium CG17_big_fil_post_rev_8_21_14_2_50_50_9]PIW84738.1 MAG: PHP domain-containing protein [Nitrospirae bacterium CG_4_8_14_3_um_filter_50_41]
MIDLHTHTLLSDGALLPSELARRAEVIGYKVMAFTDHVDHSNLDYVVTSILMVCKVINARGGLRVIPGVEITHVSPAQFGDLAARARALGAKIVVAHGETLVEPVAPGTNRAAIEAGVDILAHPGLISEEEVELAMERRVLLEITTRKGHSLSNGHVARLAMKLKAGLVINTDTHDPQDLVERSMAERILMGAGLTPDTVHAVFKNSEALVQRLK